MTRNDDPSAVMDKVLSSALPDNTLYPGPDLLQVKDPAGGLWERQHQNFEQRFPKEYVDPEKAKGTPLNPGTNFYDPDKGKITGTLASSRPDLPNPFSDIGKYTPQAPTSKPGPNEPNPLKFWEHPSPKVIPIREGYKLTPVDHDPFKMAMAGDNQHPPLQIDVLGGGVGVHSGPGFPQRPAANDLHVFNKLDKANPELIKYYRALLQQRKDPQAQRELEQLKSYDNWKEAGKNIERLKSRKPALSVVNPDENK